jgi:hypothetical protein
MADKKISELDAATALDGTELVPIVQGGETVRTTVAAIGRETVTADRVYYVNNSTGSDSNSGLTSLLPFLTIQKAVDVICNDIFISGAKVSIQLADTAVNYDEFLDLGPWQGTLGYSDTQAAYSCIEIIGNTADGSAVVIRPTSGKPADRYVVAVVQSHGTGANWALTQVTVEADGVTGDDAVGCIAAVGGAGMYVQGGNLGEVNDPLGAGIAQLQAYNYSWLRWDRYGATSSHVYGDMGASGSLAYAISFSNLLINNVIVFDNDPNYFAVLLAATNSDIVWYHNFSWSGSSPTGLKYWLQNSCHGYATLTDANIPGATKGALDDSSSWNGLAIYGPATVANLPSTYLGQPSTRQLCYVTDATATTLGSTVAGGGANSVLVWYNGANWIIVGGGTAGGTPGGATTQVQFNNAGAFAGDDEFTYDSTGAITLGKATGGTGAVKFKGTTSGTVTLSTADAAGTWTMKLPTSAGTNTHVLTTDGTGVTSWSAPGTTANLVIGTSTITSGTTTRVLYDLAGVVQEAASFTISSGQPNVAATKAYLLDGEAMIRAQGASTGQYNYFFGEAGNYTNTGSGNMGMGAGSLGDLTNGSNNVAVGLNALDLTTSGGANVGLGTNAGRRITTGANNMAIGNNAMLGDVAGSTGSYNVAIGYAAGNKISAGSYNICIGGNSGANITNGNYNTSIGYNALTTASVEECVAIGVNALQVATGSNSTAIGTNALADLTSGTLNTAIGRNTGRGITTGGSNTIIGAGVTGLSSSLANAVILADGAGAKRFDYNVTTASTITLGAKTAIPYADALSVGASGVGTGKVLFNGTTSGVVTLSVADAAGTWTMKLPATDGNAGEFLQTDGSGVTTWARPERTAVTFANVPGTPATGMVVAITDSNTATWGATIAGGGANTVLGWYNGTNWTVIGA